jgi:DNA mismatch endonuclease (patch repair protein)
MCERALRSALWKLGLRYRVDVAALPGRPDIVFASARVAVFCDGDFWHGRDLEKRLAKLARGHNAPYWSAKIRTNVARDRRRDDVLERDGWLVLRFWESDIVRDAPGFAARVAAAVAERRLR